MRPRAQTDSSSAEPGDAEIIPEAVGENVPSGKKHNSTLARYTTLHMFCLEDHRACSGGFHELAVNVTIVSINTTYNSINSRKLPAISYARASLTVTAVTVILINPRPIKKC